MHIQNHRKHTAVVLSLGASDVFAVLSTNLYYTHTSRMIAIVETSMIASIGDLIVDILTSIYVSTAAVTIVISY